MSITVQTGVGTRAQESSFMNATMQTASDTHTMSIAVTLPSGGADAAGVDLDDEASVRDWISTLFASAIAGGCDVHIQVGPEDER